MEGGNQEVMVCCRYGALTQSEAAHTMRTQSGLEVNCQLMTLRQLLANTGDLSRIVARLNRKLSAKQRKSLDRFGFLAHSQTSVIQRTRTMTVNSP